MFNFELPPQSIGQAKTMLVCKGPNTVPAEEGHWFSPAAVAEILEHAKDVPQDSTPNEAQHELF